MPASVLLHYCVTIHNLAHLSLATISNRLVSLKWLEYLAEDPGLRYKDSLASLDWPKPKISKARNFVQALSAMYAERLTLRNAPCTDI